MKLKLFRNILGLACALLLLNRCGGTDLGGSEVGNPTFVGLKIVGIDQAASTKTLTDGTTLNTAKIVLERLRFRPLAECEDDNGTENDFDFVGPYVVDLLNNSTLPSLDTATIPAGSYCRIELRLHKLDSDEIPTGVPSSDPIVDNAFYAEGATGLGTAFRISIEENDTFKLENNAGFNVGVANDLFFIAFNLPEWFAGLDIDAGVQSGGVVVIDKDNNDDLYDAIVEKIKLSADLFKDANDDGSLDSDEHEDEDSLAVGEDD